MVLVWVYKIWYVYIVNIIPLYNIIRIEHVLIYYVLYINTSDEYIFWFFIPREKFDRTGPAAVMTTLGKENMILFTCRNYTSYILRIILIIIIIIIFLNRKTLETNRKKNTPRTLVTPGTGLYRI